MINKVTILDCDPGTDDAMSLFLLKELYKEPNYIISTFGNMPEEYTFKNAVILKHLFKMSSDIYRGEEKGIEGTIPTCGDFHGTDGLADLAENLISELNLSSEEFKKEDKSYIELLKILEDVDEIEYVVTGPLTTLSKIIEKDKIKEKISRVLIMGGGIKEFNKEHETEYNFSGDPIAVKKVLESGLNIYLFPLDLTHKEVISSTKINELKSLNRKPIIIQVLECNARSNKKYDNLDGAVLHDTLPILFLFNEDRFKVQDIKVNSDEWGHIEVADNGNKIKVVVELEKDFLFNEIKRGFLKQ